MEKIVSLSFLYLLILYFQAHFIQAKIEAQFIHQLISVPPTKHHKLFKN